MAIRKNLGYRTLATLRIEAANKRSGGSANYTYPEHKAGEAVGIKGQNLAYPGRPSWLL
jgi:hypothetical protein